MKKKSVQLTGHKTSLSLEPEFWDALERVALYHHTSVRQLIIKVDNNRHSNLSSAVRIYILNEILTGHI